MPRQPAKSKPAKTIASEGGELQQQAGGTHPVLTTQQGIAVPDNQNSLRSTPRGPTLLEDFILREKITHFDHERIPERVVHARGSGAHGFFELTHSLAEHTTAKVLSEKGLRVPVFCRFSTVSCALAAWGNARSGSIFTACTRSGNFIASWMKKTGMLLPTRSQLPSSV